MVTSRDVFFWAVINGSDAIARSLWKQVESPLRVALAGSFLCRKMESNISFGVSEVCMVGPHQPSTALRQRLMHGSYGCQKGCERTRMRVRK